MIRVVERVHPTIGGQADVVPIDSSTKVSLIPVVNLRFRDFYASFSTLLDTSYTLSGQALNSTCRQDSQLHSAQAQHERQRMRRRGLKPVMLVELSGPLVECMYEHGPHPGVLRYGHGAIDGVLKQGRPQMESLRSALDRQPREDHDRNRIRHTASYAVCCQLMRNGAGRHGGVATHATALIGHDEGATRTRSLIGQRPALEPVIEHSLAALELIQPV